MSSGKDVKQQVDEALAAYIDEEGRGLLPAGQMRAALAPCTVLTPEENAMRESRIARARGLAESLTLNLGPYREGSVAEIGAEIAALLSPDEAGDDCVCGEINTRHCPVHGQGESDEGDLPHGPPLNEMGC